MTTLNFIIGTGLVALLGVAGWAGYQIRKIVDRHTRRRGANYTSN